jgi:hypothetical protein
MRRITLEDAFRAGGGGYDRICVNGKWLAVEQAGRGEKHRCGAALAWTRTIAALVAATSVRCSPEVAAHDIDRAIRRRFGRTRNRPIDRIGRFVIERIDQAS